MAKVSISEAARLTGKSRTTLHRLIKTGELSTCHGARNARMVDISELIRVFGPLEHRPSEQFAAQVSEHSDTGVSAQTEQVIAQLRQEVEHLKTLVSAKDSHIDSLKQAMLLIEHKHTGDSSWWKFWKR
ncbi:MULTISPECIES: helix-turn-helix domain-containing protein [Enterobacteriaceae]|uniref:helix-turn-helix domain-containing protein n=1 Tax=Enterobacteriaceae TaxID=543 RepID=UPI0003EDF90A|nr:helix-turn-helix domain-containing protein [Escherichia coli]EMA8640012.1 helix-turn-helix domain-containing protein [Cronobacter malonaticus]HDU3466736.1 helix-turn-helix domain-containing protein [Klebsiella aerogenes]HEG2208205.1 helix-turn-helix domain-containing protein [Enterobacter cloacae]HBA6521333.1 helix-turn-helix domain-containing protein [Escherichia coli]HBA6626792.1 helix-turn-helix domain-containing protein [Escherichia coli]